MASTNGNVQISATDVMRDLECVICLEVPSKAPIYQCEEGHILCEECYLGQKKANKNCPSCEGPLVGIRCRMAEKMISKLPTRCKFSDDGCDVELMSDELSKHEEVCRFKPIPCLDIQCKEEVKVVQFVKHMAEKHEVAEQLPNEIILEVPDRFKNNKAHVQCDPVHFKVKQDDFYLNMVRVKKGLWYLWVYAISSQVSEKNKYKLEMRSEDLKEKYEYIGECSSLDKYPVKQMIGDKFCDGLIFNDTIIEKFLTSDNSLNFKIKMVRPDQPIEDSTSANAESVSESNEDDSQTESESPESERKKPRSKTTKKLGISKQRRNRLQQKKSFLSNDLATIVGRNRASRKYVMKQMWAYIRTNNLQDPSNKQVANCDEKLRRVIGKEKLKCIMMKKYLDAHISDSYQDETKNDNTKIAASKKDLKMPIKIRSNKDLFGEISLNISPDNVQTKILGKNLWCEPDELAIIEEIRQLCEQQEELERKVSQETQRKVKINTKATPMAMNRTIH